MKSKWTQIQMSQSPTTTYSFAFYWHALMYSKTIFVLTLQHLLLENMFKSKFMQILRLEDNLDLNLLRSGQCSSLEGPYCISHEGHYLCFPWEIRKIIFELSSIPLLSGALSWQGISNFISNWFWAWQIICSAVLDKMEIEMAIQCLFYLSRTLCCIKYRETVIRN